jgi:hypothetical protein
MVRRGTKGIADVMNKVNQMLDDKKEFQEIANYIDVRDQR